MDLAGNDPSLDGLAELVHDRTGGNPFFIEEVVRELVEAGYLVGDRGAYRLTKPVGDTGVPATVQAILAARIDRLETAKALLQAASVIGKEVPETALKIVADVDDLALAEGLKELIGAGFLYEDEIYPERILAFSHPLTQEVAYGSQLGEQRARAHAAAAQALIELNPERHEELAALIAQHLEQGRETLEAARWYARAAHRAGYAHPRDAMRLWAKGLGAGGPAAGGRGDFGARGLLAPAAAGLRLAAGNGEGTRRRLGRRDPRDRHENGRPTFAHHAEDARVGSAGTRRTAAEWTRRCRGGGRACGSVGR